MELAGLHDIVIKRNATFSSVLGYQDALGNVDLTGASAKMQIRSHKGAEDVLLELSTENGRITIDLTASTITLRLTDEETLALPWMSGVYDLFLYYSDGSQDPLLEGKVTVNREVTR
ncbi:hypothetical protein [Kineosporia sp. R_H_3]|uniref:hypothetical protein n=1 Tax=Kineosporia sp. R_H_3 TaxID=1961848 RepID=UPI000B4B62C7|nr:hypothetical protein [Kineosporia sp. R_H_3]